MPEPKQKTEDQVVKVQEPEKLIQLIERLELPGLCLEERLGIAGQQREMFGGLNELSPLNSENHMATI